MIGSIGCIGIYLVVEFIIGDVVIVRFVIYLIVVGLFFWEDINENCIV